MKENTHIYHGYSFSFLVKLWRETQENPSAPGRRLLMIKREAPHFSLWDRVLTREELESLPSFCPVESAPLEVFFNAPGKRVLYHGDADFFAQECARNQYNYSRELWGKYSQGFLSLSPLWVLKNHHQVFEKLITQLYKAGVELYDSDFSAWQRESAHKYHLFFAQHRGRETFQRFYYDRLTPLFREQEKPDDFASSFEERVLPPQKASPERYRLTIHQRENEVIPRWYLLHAGQNLYASFEAQKSETAFYHPSHPQVTSVLKEMGREANQEIVANTLTAGRDFPLPEIYQSSCLKEGRLMHKKISSWGQTVVEYLLMLLVTTVVTTFIFKKINEQMVGETHCPNDSLFCSIVEVFQGPGHLQGNFRSFSIRK